MRVIKIERKEMKKYYSLFLLTLAFVTTAIADPNSIKLRTGIEEAKAQYERLNTIRDEVIRDVPGSAADFKQEFEVDHHDNSPLNLWSKYQASFIVPPMSTDYEGTALRKNRELQDKIKGAKEKMNLAIKKFATDMKEYNRASGSSKWTLQLEKLRNVVEKGENVTPEQRAEFLKFAFKYRNNFTQGEKEHFVALTKAHKEYATEIKGLVKDEIKAAKDNVTYAKKLNKKLKKRFFDFNTETSPFKKAVLASQLMLLRSELVVDTGGGILESLERMIEVSSIGRLIEKKIKEQESACIDLKGKINPVIVAAKKLVCQRDNKEKQCKEYQKKLRDAFTTAKKPTATTTAP